MKTRIFALCAMLLMSLCSISAKVADKPKKEVITYLVSMTCKSCQQRIEKNIPYEKGVTDLKVDLAKKLVTIEYRTDKTCPDKLKAAFKKMGFTATPFKGAKAQKSSADKKTKSCCTGDKKAAK